MTQQMNEPTTPEAGPTLSTDPVAPQVPSTLPTPIPTVAAAPAARPEYVIGGLAMAGLAIVGGIILTGIIWELGFIAGIASYAMAAGAVVLYAKGAGAPPRQGIPALIALIVVGIAISFFVCVGIDLSDYYSANAPADAGISRMHFITSNLFTGEVLGSYGKDILMFVLFGALGVFGTVRRLLASRKS